MVKSYEKDTSDTEVNFKIKFDPDVLYKLMQTKDKDGVSRLERELCLVRKMSYKKKLNIFNEKVKLIHFKNDIEIVNYHYKLRIDTYTKRKAYMLEFLDFLNEYILI